MHFNFPKKLKDLSETELVAILKNYLINLMTKYKDGPKDVIIGKVKSYKNVRGRGIVNYRHMYLEEI